MNQVGELALIDNILRSFDLFSYSFDQWIKRDPLRHLNILVNSTQMRKDIDRCTSLGVIIVLLVMFLQTELLTSLHHFIPFGSIGHLAKIILSLCAEDLLIVELLCAI